MVFFDKTKCDCCVCPMQFVLEQLVSQEVGIETQTSSAAFQLNEVKNFIAFTNQGTLSICNISAVILPVNFPLNIKPIKKSKGECVCCEDPITNLAKSLIGKRVLINYLQPIGPLQGLIIDVGEGIVLIEFEGISGLEIAAISACIITEMNPVDASSNILQHANRLRHVSRD
ncbi:hypothetical protein [Chengkuizengella axinellae]|uniref:Uncharacterized protein n=1 Tax=Chengkuizengella axinellae TaxID=3064388 RepID=A0ABT9IZ44_9BACL|nr:hypothetical protein [Chengkuizengella sp. 2205SS18-9]MDP5274064.1 hypothetical protein [Chengkuizengella sp. 2205SS18-9]